MARKSKPSAFWGIRAKRALRWLRNKGGNGQIPPRHIGEPLGWRYASNRTGQILHVPRGA